jgi:hypothetical protein
MENVSAPLHTFYHPNEMPTISQGKPDRLTDKRPGDREFTSKIDQIHGIFGHNREKYKKNVYFSLFWSQFHGVHPVESCFAGPPPPTGGGRIYRVHPVTSHCVGAHKMSNVTG